METQIKSVSNLPLPTCNEFANQMDITIARSHASGRGLFIVLIQISGLEEYKKRRPVHVVHKMMSEIGKAVRRAVHPSQYVGFFQNGLGIIFDGVDTGSVDVIANRVSMIVSHIIQKGNYNDFTSQWADAINQ